MTKKIKNIGYQGDPFDCLTRLNSFELSGYVCGRYLVDHELSSPPEPGSVVQGGSLRPDSAGGVQTGCR